LRRIIVWVEEENDVAVLYRLKFVEYVIPHHQELNVHDIDYLLDSPPPLN
jgi:hypothetical protein